MSKTFFCDLNEDDLRTIYAQNNALRAEVVADYSDMINDIITGEIRHTFKCADITRAKNDCFIVHVAPAYYTAFIDALPQSQFGYDVLSDPHMRIIYDYLNDRRAAYGAAPAMIDDARTDDEKRLLACFDTGIRLLCDALENALAAFCDEINDGEKLFNYFLENYGDMYGEEYYIRDGYLGTVYKTITKKYE